MSVHKFLPLMALGLNLLLLGSALAPDRRSHRNLLFAYLATALAVWNLGVFGLRTTADPDAALAWERFLHFGVIPIPVLFYHYVLGFLDTPRRRLALIVGYTLCGVFLAAGPTPAFLRGVTDSAWGFMPAAGPLYAPFFVYFQSYLVLGLVRLVQAYGSQASSFKRNRTLLVIVGVAVSLLGGVVDFARFMLSWDWLYPIGIPSNAIFALALGVAIVRYRLMDIGVLAKRIVLYLLTSAALAPILFLGLWGFDQLVLGRSSAPKPADGVGIGTLTRDAVILLLVFTVALPLLRKLDEGLERLMFWRRHGVRDALLELIKKLGSLLEVSALGRTLTEGLVTQIPVLSAELYRYDAAADRFTRLALATAEAVDTPSTSPALDRALALWLRMTGRTLIVEETSFWGGAYAKMRPVVRQLERDRVALVVPLFMEGEVAAILVVGEKLSGEIFDGDEIDLLEMLAGETVIALRNAGLYQDLHSRMDELQRTQEALVQSAKLAAIGGLAASVAHEINNPLTGVLVNCGLLLRQLPPDSAAYARVSAIEAEGQRAGKIVRDLLDFARQREPEREPVSVHELLERAIELLSPKLAGACVEIERVFDVSLPALAGDRDQLTQVFLNLIANALDAMQSGGRLVLQTGIHQEDDGRTMVSVSVSDTGPGIPPERRARIFEPFYTTKGEGLGTGLGLSVSLRIVQMHGGSIDVESKLGHGTTMRITLPVR